MATVRILKLGGSLLLRSDWPQRLRAWLDQQTPGINLLIVGGGQIIDAVRELDRAHALDKVFVHWLCVDLLAATAQIASQLLPEFGSIRDPQQLQGLFASLGTSALGDQRSVAAPVANYLVDVAAFYTRDTHTTLMDEDWSTTSDSIAAWLALQSQADELVIFKSVSAPVAVNDLLELAKLGIVDEGLPTIWGERPGLKLVNLLEWETT